MADEEGLRESSGVQALIDRLREDGVAAGRREGERIVEDAHARAADIVARAREEADGLLAEAREQAAAERRAAEDALKIAARDTVLALKEDMALRFSAEVKRLVSAEMADRELVRRLVLEVAGRAAPPPEEPVEVLLPTEIVGVEELRARPDEASRGALAHAVLGLSRDLLRAGVTLKPDEAGGHGIRLRLTGQDLEIDLTAEAIAELLLRHLLPRFRALLEGIVR